MKMEYYKRLGWFPGYAIDIETGERLNIIFSEDSWQTSENGSDMKWNPTGRLITDEFPQYQLVLEILLTEVIIF